MKTLGCNYSEALMALIKEKEVHVDWIKLANENKFDEQLEAVNKSKPCLFHIAPCVLFDEHLKGWTLERVNKAIANCQSPHVGVHLRGKLESNDREQVKKQVVRKINDWNSLIKTEYLIENMPVNRLPKDQSILCEPSFIKEVCEASNIGLLLDIAHLKVSAHYLNMSEEAYLHALPLDRIKEIHISGARKDETGYYDAHEYLREEDYVFLEKVLEVTSPNIVTLEYGGGDVVKTSKSELHKQLTRLRAIIST